jgi:hypothetical protein
MRKSPVLIKKQQEWAKFFNKKESFRNPLQLSRCPLVPRVWRRWRCSQDSSVASHQIGQTGGCLTEHSCPTFPTPRESEHMSFSRCVGTWDFYLTVYKEFPAAKIPLHLGEEEGSSRQIQQADPQNRHLPGPLPSADICQTVLLTTLSQHKGEGS